MKLEFYTKTPEDIKTKMINFFKTIKTNFNSLFTKTVTLVFEKPIQIGQDNSSQDNDEPRVKELDEDVLGGKKNTKKSQKTKKDKKSKKGGKSRKNKKSGSKKRR